MRLLRLGSIRLRTTLLATAATAAVLAVASIVLVQLVERNLASNSRIALSEALESASHAASGEKSGEGEDSEGAAHAQRGDIRHEQIAESSIREVQSGVDAVAGALLVIVPAVVLLLGGAIWIIAGRALRPVRDISRQVAAIGGSTLDERVPEPDSDDEIAELAASMNEMLDRLQAASDRQRAFVADASHELRSPLATIIAAAEIAEISNDHQRIAALAPRIEAEARRMQALAEDLLDLARLDEQRHRGDLSAVDLAAVCRDAADRLDGAGIDITVSVDGSASALGVLSQIERAVFNVMDNAVRHAANQVRAAVASGGVGAEVVVEDDGVGIPAADRERVFDRFVRLDASRQRASGGVGIGLSLVKAIVDRHGGTVEIGESDALGGAAVRIVWPPAADR